VAAAVGGALLFQEQYLSATTPQQTVVPNVEPHLI